MTNVAEVFRPPFTEKVGQTFLSDQVCAVRRTDKKRLLLNSLKGNSESGVVDVGTALVAVRIRVRTGTSPVPT
jgi:hypothetical protein